MIACTICVQCSVSIQQRSNATHDFNSMCVLTTRKRSARHALRITVEPIGIYKRRQRSANTIIHSNVRSKKQRLLRSPPVSLLLLLLLNRIVLNFCNFRRDFIRLCSVYRQNSIFQKCIFIWVNSVPLWVEAFNILDLLNWPFLCYWAITSLRPRTIVPIVNIMLPAITKVYVDFLFECILFENLSEKIRKIQC